MNTNQEYQIFLDNLVRDAISTSRELEVDVDEVLQNIMECIHQDAAEKLADALVNENSNGNDFSI
jgi:hypothetical protein